MSVRRQQAGRGHGCGFSDVSGLGGAVGVVLGTRSDVSCIRSDVSGINGCGFLLGCI